MAVLTVTIKEEVTINGNRHVFENVHTETVTDIFQRVYGVLHTAESELLSFASADAGGTFSDSDLDYLRITNLDSTNFVNLRVTDANDEYFVKIEAGDSFLLNNSVLDVNDNVAGGAATVSYTNIDSIKAKADTATCNVEIVAFS
jgi:hypothetical protein